MTDSRAKIGKTCVAAYERLLEECIAFGAAQVYLLELDNASQRGTEPIKEFHGKFLERLNPNYVSPYHYFVERSFVSLVATLELFLQDVTSAVILANPKKIGQVDFKLADILDATGNDELVQRGIEQTFNKLMYKKPMEYLADIAALLSIDERPLRANWPIFVEAKARRDLGVHNGWRCNLIYMRKLTEVGLTSQFIEGQVAFPHESEYLESVGECLSKLAGQITQAVLDKHVKV